MRTVYALRVEQEGDLICIRVSGNGFLYNMVRIIAGTLGAFEPEDMQTVLEAADRQAAGPTAPAKGLTLTGMTYSPKPEEV